MLREKRDRSTKRLGINEERLVSLRHQPFRLLVGRILFANTRQSCGSQTPFERKTKSFCRRRESSLWGFNAVGETDDSWLTASLESKKLQNCSSTSRSTFCTIRLRKQQTASAPTKLSFQKKPVNWKTANAISVNAHAAKSSRLLNFVRV